MEFIEFYHCISWVWLIEGNNEENWIMDKKKIDIHSNVQ